MPDDPTLPFNVETIVATLAHIAVGAGNTEAVAALDVSTPKLTVTGYDNWNGGTYELTLYLEVPIHVFGQLFQVREAMEKNLLTMLKPIIEAEGGYWASAVTFIPTDKVPSNWRDLLRGDAVTNQGLQFSAQRPVLTWNGLRFRSHTEIRIAQELDRRKVLFLPNCLARLGFSERQNREADFLICADGKWGILEVDGDLAHPPTRTAEDHERDRLFQAHGIILAQHFAATECWENADGVVTKFLALLRKTK